MRPQRPASRALLRKIAVRSIPIICDAQKSSPRDLLSGVDRRLAGRLLWRCCERTQPRDVHALTRRCSCVDDSSLDP